MLWDFAGQDIYKPAHAPFFSEKTLFLLCIDLYDYASKIKHANIFRAIQCEKILWQYAEANVLCWLRLIFSRQPNARVVLVGTKRDLVKDHDVEEVKKNAKATIGKWKSAFSKQLDVELARLREEKLDEKAVESTYDDAINGAVQEIEEIVSSSKLGDVMSPKCRDALTKVYERRQDAKGKKGAEWLETLMMPPKDLGDPESVKFLHDLGDVLWFKDESSGMLEDFVILEPKLVIDFIRQVVSHELIDPNEEGKPEDVRDALNDLSGVCYHKESPIEIRVSGGLLSQYGKYLQVGLSIVSNIVPTAMDLGLLKAAVDHAKEVIAQRTDEAIKVRSLLANFDFVEHTVKVISVSQEMKVKNDRLELKFQFVGKNGQSEVTVNPPTDGRDLDWSTAAVNSKTMESITSIRECLLVAWAGRRRFFPFLKPHVFLNATCELGVYFPAGSGPGTTASWSPSNNFKFELTLRQKDRAP
ncbi:hypothetical protein ATCC90586_002037 [Pythium insidiosum]|nr:hypothetical protein ATCC90586_002037 [Pythium insidiosum]